MRRLLCIAAVVCLSALRPGCAQTTAHSGSSGSPAPWTSWKNVPDSSASRVPSAAAYARSR